jgi:hypothetical protein
MGTSRRALLALAVTLGLSGLFASRNEGAAAPIEMTWSLFARADATSFTPGNTPAGVPAGYEIVSFDAVGLAPGLSTYTYGGADLPASLGGPLPPLVSCESTVTASELHLDVAGAYPYAGCVFFVGAANTGEDAARFELGPLDDDATVTCNVDGCQASDIEMLAGGAGDDPLAGCVVTGSATAQEDGTYALTPGSQVVCPVFVIVLQPAKENATYTVQIAPPEPQPAPQQTIDFDDPPDSFANPPVRIATAVTPPTETPTPTATPVAPTVAIAGERTPGATPIPPDAGDSVVVRHGATEGSPAAGLLLLAAGALAVVAAWPGLRHARRR